MSMEGATFERVPEEIYTQVISLHNFFATNMNIELPHARAAGMIFFHKYYQMNDRTPREYALMAIASLCLACKVYDIAKQVREFVAKLTAKIRMSTYSEALQKLDGVPTYLGIDFEENLIRRVIQVERELMQALSFRFEVHLPYNTTNHYVKRILLWHISSADGIFSQLFKEIQGHCWEFIDTLFSSPAFYIHDPTMIALAVVKIAFRYLRLEIVSPSSMSWNAALAPQFSDRYFNIVFLDIDKYLDSTWREKNHPFSSTLRTPFDTTLLKQWRNYPLLEPSHKPLCPPPPLNMMEQLIEGDESYKNLDSYHLPKCPPPITLPTAEHKLMMDDFKVLETKARNEQLEEEKRQYMELMRLREVEALRREELRREELRREQFRIREVVNPHAPIEIDRMAEEFYPIRRNEYDDRRPRDRRFDDQFRRDQEMARPRRIENEYDRYEPSPRRRSDGEYSYRPPKRVPEEFIRYDNRSPRIPEDRNPIRNDRPRRELPNDRRR